ncbi:hypothetical protein RSAG8_09083, partial [Rhizoctonia solani AG-8 WAC10335]
MLVETAAANIPALLLIMQDKLYFKRCQGSTALDKVHNALLLNHRSAYTGP